MGGWMEPWDLLLPSTFSSSNLLPPPSYSSQLLHPPPKPPPNSSYHLLKGLRWLTSSYMKVFQCYSAQKSFMGGGGWRHCNYSYKLQVKVSKRFEIDLGPGPSLTTNRTWTINWTFKLLAHNSCLLSFFDVRWRQLKLKPYYDVRIISKPITSQQIM